MWRNRYYSDGSDVVGDLVDGKGRNGMSNYFTDDCILKIQEDLWELKAAKRTNKDYIADHEVRIADLEKRIDKVNNDIINILIWLMIISGIIAGIAIGLVMRCF